MENESQFKEKIGKYEYLVIRTSDIKELTQDNDGFYHIVIGKETKLDNYTATTALLIWRGIK